MICVVLQWFCCLRICTRPQDAIVVIILFGGAGEKKADDAWTESLFNVGKIHIKRDLTYDSSLYLSHLPQHNNRRQW